MQQFLEFANDNALLVTATVLMALAVLFYELRLRGRRVFEVSSTQAVRLINDGAKIVDVRDPKRFETGHIVDSVNIPLEQLGRDPKLPKARVLIVVCDRGVASLRGVDVLRKAGFEHAYSLRGGVEGWKQENLPLVTGQ